MVGHRYNRQYEFTKGLKTFNTFFYIGCPLEGRGQAPGRSCHPQHRRPTPIEHDQVTFSAKDSWPK